MRLQLVVITFLASSCIAAEAVAQNLVPCTVTPVAGNEANGKDYQPTPNEVAPREKAAGIVPTTAQQKATNQDLERTDKALLRQQGLSTRSVPKFNATQ